MEAIDLNDLEPISISLSDSAPQSTNSLGEGIELLMNDKKSTDTSKTKIDLGELDKLEDELNDLSSINLNIDSNNKKYTNTTTSGDSETKSVETSSFGGFAKSMFGIKDDTNVAPVTENDSKLGSSTADAVNNQTKTWDGFTKLGNIGGFQEKTAPATTMTDREKRRKKRAMLKALETWHEKGFIKEMSRLNMESDFDEIEDEYESALEDKRKRDAVKIQGNWLITMVNTIEYGNSMFDPFGVSLDGWGESISEDIDSYNEIFEELHEKYKGGKMSPELSLLLRLGFSASVVHFSNKALSTAAPGFNDVIKQSPELMRMFTDATVSSMKQTAPGMAFASELLQQNKPGTNHPPPAPVKTRDQPPPQRPGMQYTSNNETNIGSAMFRESGVNMNQQASINEPPKRPEMSGPKNSDINNILSGLKTKNVDIRSDAKDNDSVVSISSIKDMSETILPKKTSRRKSDKNVVSLDI
jgi:hypothetical protein